MTDDTFDPRDELASAHLDGETTPAEAEEVAGDPELAARVEGFAAARDAVRAGDVPVDEARRETAIAAALAAFDDAGAGVTPITRARRARQTWGPLIGVAAAALLAAVLIPLLVRDSGDSDTTTLAGGLTSTTPAPFAAEDDAGGDARSSMEAAAPHIAESETSSTVATVAPDVGVHADVGSLAAAVRAYLVAPPTTVPGTDPVPPSEAAAACIDSLTAEIGAAGGVVLLPATATLAGHEVALVVEDRPDGVRRMRVVDPADGCAPITSVEL